MMLSSTSGQACFKRHAATGGVQLSWRPWTMTPGIQRDKLGELVGIDLRGAAFLVHPVDLWLLQKEDSAQDQLGDAFGILLGIGQCERRAPASAEYLPLVDFRDLRPQLFDILDQVPGRIGL